MRRKFLVLGVVILFTWPTVAFAGAPEGPGLGARAVSMGGAFIGLADDWTATYWNPAGLTQQKTAGVGFSVDYPNNHTKDGNSAANPTLPPTQPNFDQGDVFFQPGGAYAAEPTRFNKTGTTGNSLLPGFGFYYPVKDYFVLGVSAYQPIGHSNNWTDVLTTGFGSVSADTRTKLYLNIVNISIAKQILPTFSLGAGVNFIKGRFDTYARKNTINNSAPVFSYEQVADLQTQGEGVEGTVGFLFQPIEEFSIGGVYRTGSQITFEGNRTAVHTGVGLGALNGTSRIERVFNLPATYGIGLALKPISNWVLTADWQRTEWDEMRTEIRHEQQSAALVDRNFNSGWRNTDRWRFGTEYKPLDTGLALRAGFYWDPTPIPDKAVSMTNIVEVNRKAVTMGVGYEFLEQWQIDLTYVYTWGSANINGVDYEKTIESVQTAISYRFQ